MPRIPKIDIEIWRELYTASMAFRDAAPWMRLMDSQPFAVENPANGDMGYACIMGAVGKLRALAIYRGERGLASYLELLKQDDSAHPDDFAGSQDCLMAEWTDKDFVQAEDRRVMKSLGLKFKGPAGWPVFRSYVPRYAPWHLSEDEAVFLTLGLRAAVEADRQVRAGLKIPEAGGRLLTLIPDGTGFRTEWREFQEPSRPPMLPFLPDPQSLEDLRRQGFRRTGAWEADVFMDTALIGDRERPYFYRLAMAADQDSGFILHHEPVPPQEQDGAVLGALLIDQMRKHKRVPAALDVRQKPLAGALQPLAEALDIRIRLKKNLPAISEAREGLEAFRAGRAPEAFEPAEPEEAPLAPPRMDRRAMEGMVADIFQAVKESGASSQEELDEIVNRFNRKEQAPSKPKTPVQAAQRVMYDAWEEREPSKRIALAKKALKLSPDCADAYVLLAEENARSNEEALALYQTGMEAGERALGSEFFKENVGHFWGMVESRPYMRAREGVARTLFGLGRKEEAFGHWREMLRLNTHDNQGVRYALAAELANEQRWKELAELLDGAYPDDVAAEWLFAKALLRFAQLGDTSVARQALAKAVQHNRFVPDYLTGEKAFPDHQPDSLVMGGDSEGCAAADLLLKAWRQTPGALEWLLAQTTGPSIVSKVGRNDPCPCGSGKKYKKCCAA